jgi:predicted MPP superfamily phosphohydrolase
VLRSHGGHGAYAVLGNHDVWCDGPAVKEILTEAGIQIVTGKWCSLRVHDQPILLAGCGAPWAEELSGPPPSLNAGECLRLVLTHTPDNIFRLARLGADCVFAGHCHAGHFRLPWLGSVLTPSLYGRLLDHGHFLMRDTHLFVTSGIGACRPPLRIYCQPDVFIVDIEQEPPRRSC